MKLLLDQNISPRLVLRLSDLYPGSLHVQDVDMARSDDKEVWNFAKENDFIIVTKDVDFSEQSLILGFPPKIVWIRRDNCSTKAIETILRNNQREIETLVKDSTLGILTLF